MGAAYGKRGIVHGGGIKKCQMGLSTLQPRLCCIPLKNMGQELFSTATDGTNGLAAKAMTRPVPSLREMTAGVPS
jgi:hypothetical protein